MPKIKQITDSTFSFTNEKYVSKNGSDTIGTGSYAQPFLTIQAALDSIGVPTDEASAMQQCIVKVSPGYYDEDLIIPAGRLLTIQGEGAVVLGDGLSPTTARNIYYEQDDNVEFGGVRPVLTITTNKKTETSSTHIARAGGFYVSGNIVRRVKNGGTGLSTYDMILENVKVGGDLTSDNVYGNVGGTSLFCYNCMFVGDIENGVTGSVTIQRFENCETDGIINVTRFNSAKFSEIGGNITVSSTPNTDILPTGFYQTLFKSGLTFSGPASSLLADAITIKYIDDNSLTLDGGATIVYIENSNGISNNSNVSGTTVKDALNTLQAINELNYHIKKKYNDYYYVSTTGNDANDGKTISNAFLTIQHAVDTVPDYSYIVVGEGTFEITDQIIIEKPVYVQGSGRDKTTIQMQVGVEERCVRIKEQHEAVLDGFHITGGRKRTGVAGDTLSGGGVFIGGQDGWGTTPNIIGSYIINCKITDCNSNATGGGVALHDYKSAAINCIIQNCQGVISGIAAGGGAYLRWEAYLYNCYIQGCSAPYGGGVTLQNGNSRVENCTIVGNSGSNVLNYGVNGYYVNNIIKNPASGSDIYVLSGNAYANNNCTSYNAGSNGNFNSDPLFDTDYSLLNTSPCKNAGLLLVWSKVIKDIDGKDRVVSDNISIGCREYPEFESSSYSTAREIFTGLTKTTGVDFDLTLSNTILSGTTVFVNINGCTLTGIGPTYEIKSASGTTVTLNLSYNIETNDEIEIVYYY